MIHWIKSIGVRLGIYKWRTANYCGYTSFFSPDKDKSNPFCVLRMGHGGFHRNGPGISW